MSATPLWKVYADACRRQGIHILDKRCWCEPRVDPVSGKHPFAESNATTDEGESE